MSESEKLRAIRRLIADDACAMTYQNFRSYRTMLLREIDRITKEQEASNASN